MKKKSSVIAKLIIPVAVLGCIAIMIAGVSLYSMTAVQKESNQISGEGVRATICMDEINLAFANTQKLTLALCAEPSKDLYEYVASQLTEYQSNVDSYEKELLAMDHYFTADDIQLMNETFDLLTEAQGTTVELMRHEDLLYVCGGKGKFCDDGVVRYDCGQYGYAHISQR